MQADFKFLQALFKQTLTGSKTWGLNLCSETFNMYSSTDASVCGALFRIKNPSEGNIRWSVDMSYTAYAGWGERASVRSPLDFILPDISPVLAY